MPAPGSPEWHARIAELLLEEASEPEQWWYLSFVKDDKFAGAAIVRGRGITSAVQRSHRLRLNPGGEVMAFPVGDKPKYPVNKLLSKEELGPGKTVGELEDAGYEPGTAVKFSDEV
jgi:hypothetical protein